jgi:signal transduction histidine kinase
MPENDPDLAPVAQVFNTTTADLERRVQADARFASNVSHELRTPLTTMTNAVAVLDRRRTQLPDAAREAVELLGSQIRRFERLVLDLLDLSVVIEGNRQLALEPVILPDFLRRLAAAEGWGQVEAPDENFTVSADPRRLERIISNLVANARSHGGGLVRLAVAGWGDRVRIEVDDAGPGVPPEARSLIFERFVHRPTRSGSADRGSGLGLALVAQLTALHQGRVWVEDRPEGGARFVVELPIGRTEENL